MDAYDLSAEVNRRLKLGDLDFETVERLVGDSEQSALFRLKEECHALFRFDKTSSQEELLAEELFDLAVGALFHEAMKFREGYYLTTTYRPHLERMMQAGSARGQLAETFLRVFEAGRQRMLESAQEAVELFSETRAQLLVMLQQMPQSTAIARVLVSDPQRTRRVFDVELDALLARIFGSPALGAQLAVRGLMQSGHFQTALAALERCETDDPVRSALEPLLRGLERLYADDEAAALAALESWIERGESDDPEWLAATARALELLEQSDHPASVKRAQALRERLSERPARGAAAASGAGTSPRAALRRENRKAP
jgi:hypothetical protein